MKLLSGSKDNKFENLEEPALNFSSKDEMAMDDSKEHEDNGEGEVSDEDATPLFRLATYPVLLAVIVIRIAIIRLLLLCIFLYYIIYFCALYFLLAVS